MSALWSIVALFWRAHRRAFATGLALMTLTLLAGAALLGLSGWFITACGIAGAAGVGIGFDFFRPSAGVRFLALSRTAARYGERLTTHDATLRFLAALRLELFRGMATRSFAAIGRARRATALHRLTADVDALDMIYLRLVAPALSALILFAVAAGALAWLTDPAVAAWVVGVHLVSAAGAAALGLLAGRRPARRRAYALEALRVRIIDLSRGAVDLAMAGRLAQRRDLAAKADRVAAAAADRLERLDLALGALQHLAGAIAVAGALVLGAGAGLAAETIAIAVFAAMALGEAAAPLRRGSIEAGRATLAARRVAPDLLDAAARSPRVADAASASAAPLRFDRASAACFGGGRPIFTDLSLAVSTGEWVALAGPSGGGKSTALALAAGLDPPLSGAVLLGGARVRDWAEPVLRAQVALLPQRSELFAGTILENLRLAAPDAGEPEIWEVLRIVAMEAAVRARGGLEARLGEGGAGFSGGETRRLALARLLLRRPAVALLDEPTEGLDAETARTVVAGLRARLSASAVLCASHRTEELAVADTVVRIG